MRKIDELTSDAFRSGMPFRSGNTEVVIDTKTVSLLLHGNCIAKRNIDTGIITISTCGWKTNTTKSRLNSIGAGVNQSGGKWYINGVEWDGSNVTL